MLANKGHGWKALMYVTDFERCQRGVPKLDLLLSEHMLSTNRNYFSSVHRCRSEEEQNAPKKIAIIIIIIKNAQYFGSTPLPEAREDKTTNKTHSKKAILGGGWGGSSCGNQHLYYSKLYTNRPTTTTTTHCIKIIKTSIHYFSVNHLHIKGTLFCF